MFEFQISKRTRTDIYEKPMNATDLSLLCICVSGSCVVSTGYGEYECRPDGIIFNTSDNTMRIKDISEDFQGYFLYVSQKMIEDIVSDHVLQMIDLLMVLRRNKVTYLNEKDYNFLLQSYEYIETCSKQYDNVFYNEIIKSQLSNILLYFFSLLQIETNKEVSKSRQHFIAKSFFRSLEANFQNEHRVHFYAQEQCVTSKYLSMVVKNVTGTTAGAWIDKIIVFEAQRQLKYTNKSIQQIASDLKFTNQSTFGKHFKKKTNYTPSEYRERDLYY